MDKKIKAVSGVMFGAMLAFSSNVFADDGPSDQEIFDMIDMDSSGKVSKQELHQFMTTYVDATITMDDVDAKVNSADKDGDEQLDIIEIKEI